MKLRRLAALVLLLATVVVLSAASASASRGQPYGIRAASLTQDGQQLVWQVELEHRFSAAGLAHGDRQLCMLVERVGSGAVWGEVCLARAGHHSRTPQLVYRAVTGNHAGSPTVIDATVSQPSPSTLDASFLPAAADLGYGPFRWQTESSVSPSRCTAAVARGCTDRYPGRSALLKLHTPVLVGCVASGRSLVYQGATDQREIALTFDDGPWNDPPTSQFLDVLEREQVPATFFEIGDQISTYDPGGVLERRMLADGDMIGVHTWSHPVMTKLRRTQQRTQLLYAAEAITDATSGFTPCLWRPPYGAISPSLVALARSLGLLTIMWDIDPRDWSLPGVGAIYSNVLANARSGAIVLQHFGGGPRLQTLAALPKEIDTLRARGYRFVTVDQLLGLKLVYR